MAAEGSAKLFILMFMPMFMGALPQPLPGISHGCCCDDGGGGGVLHAAVSASDQILGLVAGMGTPQSEGGPFLPISSLRPPPPSIEWGWG